MDEIIEENKREDDDTFDHLKRIINLLKSLFELENKLLEKYKDGKKS